jgi:hypothetical protein
VISIVCGGDKLFRFVIGYERGRHVLNKVLGRNDTSNLNRGLLAEGIADIFDLSSLDDGFIDDLEYPDPKDPDLTLNCV